MTKFKYITSYELMKTYPGVYESVIDPKCTKYGIIIRRVNKTKAYIIWDDEKVFNSFNCDKYCQAEIGIMIEVELCELDNS
jgi:hypothetical protein